MDKTESFLKYVSCNGSSLSINIPTEIINKLKIKKKDMVRVEIKLEKRG